MFTQEGFTADPSKAVHMLQFVGYFKWAALTNHCAPYLFLLISVRREKVSYVLVTIPG